MSHPEKSRLVFQNDVENSQKTHRILDKNRIVNEVQENREGKNNALTQTQTHAHKYIIAKNNFSLRFLPHKMCCI